jgi:carboxylesterase type B
VIQDGSPVLNHRRTTTATIAENFLARLGSEASDREGLERLDVTHVLDEASAVGAEFGGAIPPAARARLHPDDRRKGLTWTPATGSTLPDEPLASVRAGSASGVDLMLGTNRDAQTRHTDSMDDVDDRTIAQYLEGRSTGPELNEVLTVYRAALPEAPWHRILGMVMTDLLLEVPATQLAEAQSLHSERVWLYQFCAPSSPAGTAVHGGDAGLWFGNVRKGTPASDPRALLADRMAASLVRFAAIGSPVVDGFDEWFPYDVTSRSTFLIDSISRCVGDPDASRRELWAGETLP